LLKQQQIEQGRGGVDEHLAQVDRFAQQDEQGEHGGHHEARRYSGGQDRPRGPWRGAFDGHVGNERRGKEQQRLAHGNHVADDLALVECLHHADQRQQHQADSTD
jgi:hypothetical protein